VLGFQDLQNCVACLLIDIICEENAFFVLLCDVPYGTLHISLQHFPVENLGLLLGSGSSLLGSQKALHGLFNVLNGHGELSGFPSVHVP
jgi:hypothetical protein